MSTQAQKKASNKYNQENTKTYLIRLNKLYDADMIRWLDKQHNKSGYIKNLISKDIIRKMS